jgi:hypothetical protein
VAHDFIVQADSSLPAFRRTEIRRDPFQHWTINIEKARQSALSGIVFDISYESVTPPAAH